MLSHFAGLGQGFGLDAFCAAERLDGAAASRAAGESPLVSMETLTHTHCPRTTIPCLSLPLKEINITPPPCIMSFQPPAQPRCGAPPLVPECATWIDEVGSATGGYKTWDIKLPPGLETGITLEDPEGRGGTLMWAALALFPVPTTFTLHASRGCASLASSKCAHVPCEVASGARKAQHRGSSTFLGSFSEGGSR